MEIKRGIDKLLKKLNRIYFKRDVLKYILPEEITIKITDNTIVLTYSNNIDNAYDNNNGNNFNFGGGKKNHNKKLIWFHTASIGELKSIIPLIKKLNKKNKFEFLITTITLSSSHLISKELSGEQNITHRFLPIDKLNLVKKFLDNWSPNLTIFVDSEIWPNFILEIKKRKIPLVLLNGRITRKTFLRWSLLPKVAEKIFQSFESIIFSIFSTRSFISEICFFNMPN